MLTSTQAGLVRNFEARFGSQPRLFAAPGRINIIGEHTDYSEGLVMPAAIDRRCMVAVAANGSDSIRVLSVGRGQEALIGPVFTRTGGWTDYIAGVREALRDAGLEAPGCDLMIHSDVPEGAGVSSSAALEVATMSAMLAVTGTTATPLEITLWSQSAESRHVGVPCGVMDQFIAVHGVSGHALVLDCRSLSFDLAPLPDSVAFLVVDSTVRHRLTDGGYAARRADCEEAARLLGVSTLRDTTHALIDQGSLPERIYRRARHVVTEIDRVRRTAIALASSDVAEVGRLMNASHSSLRSDFDVTCPETDTLAAIASGVSGVYGARQMGGGFGGAVLALVNASSVEQANDAILSSYHASTGLTASSFVCRIADGAGEVVA